MTSIELIRPSAKRIISTLGPIYPYLFAIVLVGIPGMAGAYIVTKNIRRADISTGGFLLIYAILLGWLFAYFMPEGKLTGINYLLKMPVVLTVSILAGLIAGVMKRRRT